MTENSENHIDRLMAESKSESHIDRLMGNEGSPDGIGVITVQDQYLQQRKKEKERQERVFQPIKMDTLPDSISREIGVPEEMIDTSGADFKTRLNFSFSDTDEDIRAKFKQQYPQGEIVRLEYYPTGTYKRTGDAFAIRDKSSVLLYRERAYDDDGKWIPLSEDNKLKTIEGEGTGYKDIADLAGPSLPMAGSIAAGVLAPAGVLWGSLYFGGGYLAGELAKHEINIFGFESEMTQKEAVADAAKEGAEVGLFVAVTGGLYRLGKRLTQQGAKAFLSDASDSIKAIRKNAMEWVESVKARQANVAGLSAEQIAPENAILDRLAKQGKSTTAKSRHAEVAQREGPLAVIEADAKGSSEKVGEQLRRQVKRVYRQAKNRIQKEIFGRRRVTSEQGGKALIAGAKGWQRKYGPSGEMGREYTKLDALADEAKPVFALNIRHSESELSVREVMHQARTAVMAETQAIVKEGAVNVADTPIGQFGRILDRIDELGNAQFDYRVIKELRTQVGQVIEQWPWNSSINSHYARKVYGALTDVMLNPVNARPGTRAFVDQAVNATAKARAYYDMMDVSKVRQIIRSEDPAQLASSIGSPQALNPMVRKLIDEMPAGYSNTFKRSVLMNDVLLHPGGANARMDEWVLAHPEGWSFLVGKDKVLVREVRRAAEAIDDLRASNLFTAAKEKDLGVAKTLLRGKDVGPKEVRYLWQNSGVDGREKLRTAMYHDIVNSVVSEGKHGVPYVDPKKLKSITKEYERSGAWDIVFSNADRIHIDGMQAYINLAYKAGTDAGVSLQAAEAISQLKKPSTFISGAHRLAVNSIVARIISSKNFTQWVATHNLDKPITINNSRSYFKFFALAMEALLESTEPGQQIDPLSGRLESAVDAVGGMKVQPIIDRLSEIKIPEG
jgi:hypothetical protein